MNTHIVVDPDAVLVAARVAYIAAAMWMGNLVYRAYVERGEAA